MPALKSYSGKVDIFRNLSPATLEQIDHIKIEKRYSKNEVINREGEPARHIWFVKTGRIRSVRHLSKGQELTLTTIGPNIMFGACCAFSEGRYHCDHLADVDSVVARIPVENLKAILRFNPEASISLIENLSSRLHLARRMQTIDHENVEKRILYSLLLLKNDFGGVLQVTKRQIAEMAGTSIETCIRHMKVLEQQGMIASSRGRITVHHLDETLESQQTY